MSVPASVNVNYLNQSNMRDIIPKPIKHARRPRHVTMAFVLEKECYITMSFGGDADKTQGIKNKFRCLAVF